MSHFPVSHSNLSAPHLAAYIQAHYPIDGEVTCTLIRAGINDSYLVEWYAGRCIFRVYSHGWRRRQEIEEEIRLIKMLHWQKVPVSYPLFDLQEGYIQTFDAPEGQRFGVLFSYAECEKCHQVPAEVHWNIGAAMGRLHRETEGFELQRATYSTQNLLVKPLKSIGAFLQADSEEMAYLIQLKNHLFTQWRGADKSRLRKGAVHLDIWIDNLHINQFGLPTLFDFDFCGNGWLCLDIAYYVMQLHNIERDPAELAPKLAAFYEGYESKAKIHPEERRLLPVLGLCLYFFYLGVQCDRFHNWSNSFLSESYLKRYIQQLVKRYAELNGIVV